MEFQLVYVNCVDEEEARRIGKSLVQKRLAASANIFNQTLSYYYWEGELKEDPQSTLSYRYAFSIWTRSSNGSNPCIVTPYLVSSLSR